MFYTGLVFLAIIALLLSGLTYAAIISTMIMEYNNKFQINLFKSDISLNPINKLLLKFEGQIQVSNLIFMTQAIYLLMATYKGNSTLGFRFASPLFYPMRENETQLNSFIFNMQILIASSLAIVLFCCDKMPAYTLNTYIYRFAVTFLYSDLMRPFTLSHSVPWLFGVLGAATVLLNVCKGNYRLNFAEIERM